MSKKVKKNKSFAFVGAVIVVLVILLVGYFAFFSNTSNSGENSNVETPSQKEVSSTQNEHVVEITTQGFVPKILEIKKGDKVTFVNALVTKARPASDFHPTHTNYPGSSITKCGTSKESETFDSCRDLGKEETYSFTFNEIGSWTYHNHLQPSKDGRIIVFE